MHQVKQKLVRQGFRKSAKIASVGRISVLLRTSQYFIYRLLEKFIWMSEN